MTDDDTVNVDDETEEGPYDDLLGELGLGNEPPDERCEAPFEDLLDELGYDLEDPPDSLEQLLVYRGAPTRQCYVCQESLPGDSRNMEEGEQFIILREKPKDEIFPLVEKSFHITCWEEYHSQENA